jgi:deoxyribodipyrimidine photo-lyase
MDENVIEGTEIDWLQPGPNAALQTLQQFIDQKLQNYAEKRNDPNEDVLSNLSPYFHFGHLAPQRAALNVMSLRQKYPRSVGIVQNIRKNFR